MGAVVAGCSGVVKALVDVGGLLAENDANFPAALVAARVAGVCTTLVDLGFLELLIFTRKAHA